MSNGPVQDPSYNRRVKEIQDEIEKLENRVRVYGASISLKNYSTKLHTIEPIETELNLLRKALEYLTTSIRD